MGEKGSRNGGGESSSSGPQKSSSWSEFQFADARHLRLQLRSHRAKAPRNDEAAVILYLALFMA
jgi:hypothetical protein